MNCYSIRLPPTCTINTYSYQYEIILDIRLKYQYYPVSKMGIPSYEELLILFEKKGGHNDPEGQTDQDCRCRQRQR